MARVLFRLRNVGPLSCNSHATAACQIVSSAGFEKQRRMSIPSVLVRLTYERVLATLTPKGCKTMTDARVPYNGLKSIGAVLAGILAVVLLSLGTDIVMHTTGIFPPWFQPMSTALWLLATAYRIVHGIAGGYITARLAPDRPIRHAVILGMIGLVMSIAGAAGTINKGPEFGPKWYPLGLVVTALPCAWLGGKLFVSKLQSRAQEA